MMKNECYLTSFLSKSRNIVDRYEWYMEKLNDQKHDWIKICYSEMYEINLYPTNRY